jgi:hypothetical protein
MRRIEICVSLTATLVLAPLSALAAEPVRFNRDIQPIMADTCFKCHGPAKQEAGLRFDDRDQATKAAESGETPIVPGNPDKSELVRRIFAADESERMPPPETNKVLSAEQKELLKRWIAEGAPYEKHWSFEAVRRPALPAALDHGPPPNNSVDLFIADRLRRTGFQPVQQQADPSTLIRRVAFATTGLPPTIGEIDAFLADTSPDAYERLLDRYLGSPRHGEEMARHWLDVARYGDTHGLHLDNERQMWAYRDWVVRSFNQNKPFDQFTIEQVAGDLVPNATQEQIVGTGFLRCNVTTGEGGSIEQEWVFRNAVDRASTVAEAWLGLTAGCAVCHDHKFDPLTQKDFYSLYAFFHSAADPALDGNALLTAPTLKLGTPEQQQKLADFDTRIASKQREIDELAAKVAYTDPANAQPPPPATQTEDVWLDDEIPQGAKITASPGHPTTFVSAAAGQVHSKEKSLKRTDKGLAQDVIENTPPLAIPAEGTLFAHVWIDPQDPPRTLMLQYFKGGWLHRAVWGDYDAIDWGAKGTTQRVLIGPLPEAGKWVRLEAAAAMLGLNAGDAVTGFALTQFGGTVYWDKVGVAGRSDPAADPRYSLLAWWKQAKGKDTPNVPGDVNAILKAGPPERAVPEQEARLRTYYVQNVCLDTKPHFEQPLAELATLQKERDALDQAIPSTFIFKDLDTPRESFVMLRGQYDKPGEKVEPNVPAVLPPLARDEAARRANRLDLARWLVAPENPLTARVTVNRFWQQFFGSGLVKTSFDFGAQGEPPSHPELLDWLAAEFATGSQAPPGNPLTPGSASSGASETKVTSGAQPRQSFGLVSSQAEPGTELGWDVKRLTRLLLSSATFRQSSRVTPELLKADPENRFYARGPRIRLDAEQVRDNALFVSGLMVGEIGGKGVKPYQPPNIWEPVGFVGSNTRNYVQDHGAPLYRRSLYVFFKRTAPPPFMANFDAPSRESFCTRRERSNTPLQALQTLNDVQHFEAARALAERLMLEGGSSPAERITFAYRAVLSRPPDADELAVVQETLDKHLTKYRANPEAAKQAIRAGESPPNATLAEPELAAYTLVANLILNLDETLTRN